MTLEGHEISAMAFDATMAYGQSDKPPNGYCPNCRSPRVLKLGVESRGDIVQCLDCGCDGVRQPHEPRAK